MYKDITNKSQVKENFLEEQTSLELQSSSTIKNKIFCVYFSSASNNTHRFVEKIEVESARIPIDLEESLEVTKAFVLISPTYSGGGEFTSGAVPKQVIKFLNNPKNRNLCKGVIAGGNTNFGNTYGLAGQVLSQKLKVPLLYTFEISGTIEDIKKIKVILKNFWETLG